MAVWLGSTPDATGDAACRRPDNGGSSLRRRQSPRPPAPSAPAREMEGAAAVPARAVASMALGRRGRLIAAMVWWWIRLPTPRVAAATRSGKGPPPSRRHAPRLSRAPLRSSLLGLF